MRSLPLIVPLAAILAGCGQPTALAVTDAVVRLAAVPGRPAAGYFTLHGGATDTTLVTVKADRALRTELHESRMEAGAMRMDAIRDIPIAAHGTETFAPGGRHAMLFDVDPKVKPGDEVTLTFTFSDGQRVEQKARVVAAGDPMPTAR